MRSGSRVAAGILFCIMAASGPSGAAAQGMVDQDHPLVKRYPGSEIMGGFGSQREFDEYELLIGKLGGEEKYEKALSLQGKVTEFFYHNPEGRSVLEIYTNYEQALRKAGFQTLYSCREAACGGGKPKGYMGSGGWWDESYLRRYLAAKLARPEGDVYVALTVEAQAAGMTGSHYLAIVEVKPMQTGMVAVDAAYLKDEIGRTGHVAVYGILFDTGKWEVKPESEPALQEVKKLLAADPKLKLYVVGHTDNVGALESNLDLSRKRAAAVVDVLVKKHGVAAARLAPAGVGPVAPVASNRSEEGRAKNRRVELAEQ